MVEDQGHFFTADKKGSVWPVTDLPLWTKFHGCQQFRVTSPAPLLTLQELTLPLHTLGTRRKMKPWVLSRQQAILLNIMTFGKEAEAWWFRSPLIPSSLFRAKSQELSLSILSWPTECYIREAVGWESWEYEAWISSSAERESGEVLDTINCGLQIPTVIKGTWEKGNKQPPTIVDRKAGHKSSDQENAVNLCWNSKLLMI